MRDVDRDTQGTQGEESSPSQQRAIYLQDVLEGRLCHHCDQEPKM